MESIKLESEDVNQLLAGLILESRVSSSSEGEKLIKSVFQKTLIKVDNYIIAEQIFYK